VTSRAYIRLDPGFFERKVVEERYPAGAVTAFVSVLCLAEQQAERGRFRSERLLRLMLDEPHDGLRIGLGRWVGYLLDHGDLVRLDDRSLYVAGWDEWQEGDVTVAERMRRLRARRRDDHDDNTAPDTAPDTAPVTPTDDGPRYGGSHAEPSRATTRAPSAAAVAAAVSGGGGGSGGAVTRPPNGAPAEAVDLQYLADRMTGRPNAMPNLWSGLGAKAVELVEKHGIEAVEEAWLRIAEREGGRPTLRQLVLGSDDELNPVRPAKVDPTLEAARLADVRRRYEDEARTNAAK